MGVFECGHVSHWSCNYMTVQVRCLAQGLTHSKHSVNIPCCFQWPVGLSEQPQLWGGSIEGQGGQVLKNSLGPGQGVRSLNGVKASGLCRKRHMPKPTGNWRAWQMKESVGVCQGEFWRWLWFWTWETNFHLTTMKGTAAVLGMMILLKTDKLRHRKVKQLVQGQQHLKFSLEI